MSTLNEIQSELADSRKLLEAVTTVYGSCIDPNAEFFDGTGRRTWLPIGLGDSTNGACSQAYSTEEGLNNIRNQSRFLALENEFAINGHENRVSYIVGSGHVYGVEAKPDEEVSDEELAAVNAVIDDFIKANQWQKRQQEIVWRRDRDGEVFLRFFSGEDSILRVRFIEPEAVYNNQSDDRPNVRFGILFDEDDAEIAETYFVHPMASTANAEEVEAKDIQHRKANVDLTSPRGLPIYYPVRENLARAETLLRNMGHLAGIRSAIAMIRKHLTGTQARVQDYVSAAADVEATNSLTGKTKTYKNYPPGAVIDAPASVEYDFPTHQTDIVSFIKALQAELRAIASRLVMPEFMLSSDASNANYASTMVAEGPAVKMFEREQATMIEDDLAIMRMAVEVSDAVPDDILDRVDITAEGPNVRTRDRLKDAQADQVLVMNGVLSKHTLAARHQLEYDHEQENIEQEAEREGVITGPLDIGDEGGDDEGNQTPPNEVEDDDE